MSKFIALFLMCNVAWWQLSNVNGESAVSMDKLMETFEDALEGMGILKSLVNGIAESDIGLYLEDLADTATQIGATVPAIGAAFSLASSLIPSGRSAEKDAMVEKLKEMDFQFDQLDKDLSQLGKPGELFYTTFSEHQRDLKNLYRQYDIFIKDANCHQCKSSFAELCRNMRMDSQQKLNSMHGTIKTQENKMSKLLRLLLSDADYDWRTVRYSFQVVMKDFARAIVLSQACMGLEPPSNYERYRKQAKLQENITQEVVIQIQEAAKALEKCPHTTIIEKDVRKILERFGNKTNPKIAIELKELLDKKHPRNLWNVYSFSRAAQVYIPDTKKAKVYELLESSKPHVIVTCTDSDYYKQYKSCLTNVKRLIETHYSVKKCDEVNRADRSAITNLGLSCHNVKIVGDLGNDVFTATADNTVSVQVCKFYISLSLV